MLSSQEILDRLETYKQLPERLKVLVDKKVLDQYPEIRKEVDTDFKIDLSGGG